MTLDETNGIMAYIRVAYPNFYKGQSNADIEFAKNIWHENLAEYDYRIVELSVKKFVKTDRSGFAPTIGQLRGVIEDNIKIEYLNNFMQKSIQRSLSRIANDKVSGLIEEA